MTVFAQPVTATFPAYGQVEPIAPLPVSATEAGVITDMKVTPGAEVKAGQDLAILAGPEIEASLISRASALRSAQSQLASAERNLSIERRQLSAQMSTQQAVGAAESSVAAATAAFATAQAELQAAHEMRTVRASSAGTVLAVNAAEGERLTAGQTVLTLQPANRLWLAAVYYGSDAAAIRVGMDGRFEPASGGAAVAVKVAAVSAALAPDGGEAVDLQASDDARAQAGRTVTAPWSNGESGRVTIQGATRSLIAVPTRALILDQARWWLLVKTPKGIESMPVVPGPSSGWDTFIERGLSPGQQVVVQNAYLEYHRGIAQRYTPPD